MHKTLPYALACLTLVLLSGCVNREAQSQAQRTQAIIEDETVPVWVQPVQTQSLAEELDITGEITASDDTTVAAVVPGRLVAVLVSDGDVVASGQVIARQETLDAQMRVNQARAGVEAARASLNQARTDAQVSPLRTAAGVNAAEAQLAQTRAALAKARAGARQEERRQAEAALAAARAGMETAKANLDRMRALHREGAVALSVVEQSQSAYAGALAQFESALETVQITRNAARPEEIEQLEQAVRAAEEGVRSARAVQSLDVVLEDRVNMARAQLTSAEESLAMAEKAMRDATIRAPFAGRIAGRPMQVGSFAGPGSPVARLIGAQGMYFEAEVPEGVISRIEVGSQVEVTIGALDGRVLSGRVMAVNPQATAVARLFRVRISITGLADGIKSGMFARGRIELGAREDAAVIPVTAVLRDGEASYVFIQEGDKARRVPVRTGLESNGKIEVLDLPVGTPVIVRGQNLVVEGSTIRVEQQTPEAAAAERTGV